jgi:uncharacterized protein (DUF302 family)
MKEGLLFGLIGLLVGAGIAMFWAYKAAPGMMMKESLSKYDFDRSVEVFEEAATGMGWSVPMIHDLQATMSKFGHDVRKVKVFEICHPDHAIQILGKDQERIVSSMMPCRVSIYEKSDGKTYVSWMNTAMMGKMMGGIVSEVMGDASRESAQMIRSLTD